MPAITYARRVSASPPSLSTGPPRDHGALHRHRHASATTLRLISLSPRGILQWPEEQSRSGCGQDGGNADQSQHRRMWRCRCPLILARPSPPRQPSCSQPPLYRVPRVCPEVTALRSLPSRATPGMQIRSTLSFYNTFHRKFLKYKSNEQTDTVR